VLAAEEKDREDITGAMGDGCQRFRKIVATGRRLKLSLTPTKVSDSTHFYAILVPILLKNHLSPRARHKAETSLICLPSHHHITLYYKVPDAKAGTAEATCCSL